MEALQGKEIEICKRIDEMRDEIVTFLRDLIQINSEVPPGHYDEIIQFFLDKVKGFGFETEIIEKPGTGKPNILARLSGTQKKPTLLYNGHLDTVPGGDGWDPFKPEIKDGIMYGRGAMDCKGMVAAYTMAAKALKESGVELRGNLDMLSIVDDEIGGDDTWHYIVEKRLVHADAIIAEGGGQGVIANCSSTVLVLEVEVKGKATHAQTERTRKNGINALLKMNKVIDAIDKYSTVLESKVSKVPNLERCYMNIANIKGGIEGIWNIFPERCIMQMELRLVPDYNPDEIVREIKEVVEDLKRHDRHLNAEVRELWRVPGFKVPSDLPMIKILHENIQRVTGKDVPTGGLGGFVPIGHFFGEMGIPGVTWNPGMYDECNLHQAYEKLPLEDLINATKIFALTAMQYLGMSAK
jgi:succinyl-diaminopimelate desuccinylase